MSEAGCLKDTGNTDFVKLCSRPFSMLLPRVDKGSTAAQTLASSASLISLALPGLSSEISMEQLFSMDWVTMTAGSGSPPHGLALTASRSAGVLLAGTWSKPACRAGADHEAAADDGASWHRLASSLLRLHCLQQGERAACRVVAASFLGAARRVAAVSMEQQLVASLLAVDNLAVTGCPWQRPGRNLQVRA